MHDLISRQAAIDGKIYIRRSNGVEIYDDYVVPVEYLKQLPPAHGTNLAEVGTDCISRQAAIDAVNCVMVMKGIRSGKGITAEAVDCAKRIIADNIRQLPPIQPRREERKTGEWIYDWGDWDFETCKCSECGNHITTPIGKRYSFCPNCGADMRGEQK